MHIGLISQEYPPETAKGGIGTQTWHKARELARLGHTVTVVSRSPDGQRTDTCGDGIRVVRIAHAKHPAHTEIGDWLQYSQQVCDELDQLQEATPFDLLDFPEWAAEAYAFLLNRTPWHHVPVVIQLHGPLVMLAHELGWPEPDSDFYRVGTHMERACLELADAVYSSSQCSLNWCARQYGLEATASPVLHSGIDLSIFRTVPAERPHPPTLVFTGKLAFNKGVDELVRACCVLADEYPGLTLKLVGRGNEKETAALQRLAHGSRLRLEWSGFMSGAELAGQYAQSDLFCAPSHYEGGPGFVYLEAMACGLPVVACSGSGAEEAVRDGETGLLVPPRDVDALTCALRTLLRNPLLRKRLGETSARYAREHADARTCVAAIEAFYRDVRARFA